MKPFGVAGATVAAVSLAHVLPAATWLDHPTLEFLPRLKGVGRDAHVAITFDDGPDPVSTPRFLDELDRLGWTATFFLIGEMARRSPRMVTELVDRGHEIGLHGDHHRSHLLMTPNAVRRDLTSGVATITDLTGQSPRWFRPPYGELACASVIMARRLGLHPMLWSAWGKDWRADATPASIAATVVERLTLGGTILLHDSDSTSAPGSWKATLDALSLIADHIPAGVSVGPLRDHFHVPSGQQRRRIRPRPG